MRRESHSICEATNKFAVWIKNLKHFEPLVDYEHRKTYVGKLDDGEVWVSRDEVWDHED